MAQVHYTMYTCKLVRIMSLPPTGLNLFVHVHFQMLLQMEGSRLSRSFRRFNLRIWPGDQGLDHLSLYR